MRTEVKFWIITTYVGKQAFSHIIRHHIALRKVTERSTEFSARSAVLQKFKRQTAAAIISNIDKILIRYSFNLILVHNADFNIQYRQPF